MSKPRIPVNVDGEDHARLARLSERTGVPASVMVRRAVREWLQQNEARMAKLAPENSPRK